MTPHERVSWRTTRRCGVKPTTGAGGRKRAINLAVLPAAVEAMIARNRGHCSSHQLDRGPSVLAHSRGIRPHVVVRRWRAWRILGRRPICRGAPKRNREVVTLAWRDPLGEVRPYPVYTSFIGVFGRVFNKGSRLPGPFSSWFCVASTQPGGARHRPSGPLWFRLRRVGS